MYIYLFIVPILPLFIDTKICMQIYISMPKALRRPKYKLFFSLDDPPPRGGPRPGRSGLPRGGTTHYPPAAGPAAGRAGGDFDQFSKKT